MTSRSHLPHFIEDKLIYSCNLNLSRKQRSILALLRNIQFYEVHNKQISNYIDLQNTILSKLQYKFDSIELELNGTSTQASDILGSFKTCTNHDVGGIMIGKYIYQNRNYKMVYILLKCWNSLVVIKRDSEGFILQAEYEDVRSFHVSKGSDYQDQITISFLQNVQNDILTNFQSTEASSLAVLPKADVYRKMLERIKIKKSELLVHQTITRKEFAKLKSTELFGCNALRTPRLEELQILSKCGNAWVKLTADDDVVVGVPLVNNCSSRLTTLRNFRAVLHGVGDLSHSFKLYQLNKSFCDMESIEGFFNDSESTEQYATNSNWRQCLDLCLRPEAFAVLIIKLNINELFFESGLVAVPLFAFYDVYKSNSTFNQKCFLTTISFKDIFTNEANRLNYDEKHLNRDLLTVIASSYETEVRLDYVVTGADFEDYLCRKLGFHNFSQNNQSCSEAMNVDGQDDEDNDANDAIKEKLIFYNKNPNSVWHGTLIEIVDINSSASEARIFTKSQEKSKVFLKLLRVDLKAICGIKEVRDDIKRTLSNALIEFEAALREECSSCMEMCSSSAMKKDRVDIDKKIKLHNRLHLMELKTDLLFKYLKL